MSHNLTELLFQASAAEPRGIYQTFRSAALEQARREGVESQVSAILVPEPYFPEVIDLTWSPPRRAPFALAANSPPPMRQQASAHRRLTSVFPSQDALRGTRDDETRSGLNGDIVIASNGDIIITGRNGRNPDALEIPPSTYSVALVHPRLLPEFQGGNFEVNNYQRQITADGGDANMDFVVACANAFDVSANLVSVYLLGSSYTPLYSSFCSAIGVCYLWLPKRLV